MSDPIIDNVGSIICTSCNGSQWEIGLNEWICKSCNNKYKLKNNKLITIKNHIEEKNWETVGQGFDLFKGNEKAIKVDRIGGPRIKDLRKKLEISGLSLNLGSGKDKHEGFLNIDLGEYESVHIVADLTKVPVRSGSVELLVSNSVLEHIYNYNLVIDEAHRILATGGYFYLCVPNAGCIRHHKFDYHRWTSVGLKKIFEDRFEVLDSGACRGIAYTLITYVEALISYKIKNRFVLTMLRSLWRLLSRPLFWIKEETSEEYQALSQTIYILVRKL